VARPGDLFVLLLPDEGEVGVVRARQEALRERYGGRPHEPVHLTCQRFALPDGDDLAAVVGRLRRDLAGLRPCPIQAEALVAYRSPFWKTRLLRWSIAPTAELLALKETLQTVLADLRLESHYPWLREASAVAHVTALEGIDERELAAAELAEGLPRRLYVGRRVVVSRLRGGRGFDRLDSFTLAG
jgi:hypothetical protein